MSDDCAKSAVCLHVPCPCRKERSLRLLCVDMAEQDGELSAKAVRKAVKHRAGWLLENKECGCRFFGVSFAYARSALLR